MRPRGAPGARAWRRILTVGAVKPGADISVIREALAALDIRAEAPQTDAPEEVAA